MVTSKPIGSRNQRHVVLFSTAVGSATKLRFGAAPESSTWVPERTERTRIWELSALFHCSIVGTCLSTGDVRHLLTRLGVEGARELSEHEIHVSAVQLAACNDFGGKLLNKTLDKKHHAHVARYAKAKASDDVLAMWQTSLKDGDIPGAYWAAMTHPATTDAVLRKIFDDVHMLSHLVGAANRADLKRLRELEQANEALAEKVRKQQQQLRDAVVGRDALIADLQRQLATRSFAAAKPSPDAVVTPPPSVSSETLHPHLIDRLAKLGRRGERLAIRVEALTRDLQSERKLREVGDRERERLLGEIQSLEAGYDRVESDDGATSDLAGRTILYVGGRTHHIPRLRSATIMMDAVFVHHDGGDECASRLITPMIGRADLVMFPVDCVSHEAVGILKKTCRQLGKPYVALRSSGLASFLNGVRATAIGRDRDRKSADALSEAL